MQIILYVSYLVINDLLEGRAVSARFQAGHFPDDVAIAVDPTEYLVRFYYNNPVHYAVIWKI